MFRRVFFSLALGLAASCAVAQTAPSPADVGISKGTPDVFKLKSHDNIWTPFGSIAPSTHIFVPATNGNIAPNDCVKWGPGLTSAGAACNSVTGGATPANQLTIYTNHAGLLANVTTPTEAWTVQQQGFYAPGDGGAATYQWNSTSLCPGGAAPPRADGIICVLPVGQSVSTPGRYLLQVPSKLDVRMVGMQPGGQDNSPYVRTLLNAVGNVAGLPAASEIVFSPTLPTTSSSYFFSQPFVASRNAKISCGGVSLNSAGPVVLVFPPGIDGIIQEQAALSPDGGYGQNDIGGCSIISLGAGYGMAGYITFPKAKVYTGGTGYGAGTGTLTHVTSGLDGVCSPEPAYTVTASGGAITAVTTTVNIGHCTYGIPTGSLNWVASGAVAGGSGASLNVSDTQINVPNADGTATGQLSNFFTANDPSFPMPASCNPINNTCTIGVGDGIVTMANWLPVPGTMGTEPGAYVGAIDNVAHKFTLASGFHFLPDGFRNGSTGGGAGIVMYDLPAAQKFTVNTVTGSTNVTVTAAPLDQNGAGRILKPGDVIWNDAFLFGTSVRQLISNSIVGAVTVHSGGSGLVGTSGTMTWSGGCGFGASPVLNVTAAGGVITGVTGVANAGNCLSGVPSSTATAWTPGGGLSGGNGDASFNMTFNQVVTMGNITEQGPHPDTLAKKTETGGKLWTIPVGIHRRVQAATHNDLVQGFGIGLKHTGGGTQPATGGNGDFDERSTFSASLIGRLIVGDNSGGGMTIGNTYAQNTIADEIEAGTVGSTYIGEVNVSQDNGSAIYGTLILCTSDNFSVFIGGYYSGQGRFDTGYARGCLGQDADGNDNIGTPAAAGNTSGSWISPLFGSPLPLLSAGGNVGGFGFSGKNAIDFKTTATSAAGQKIVNLAVGTSTVMQSQTITDATNPDAIPAGTVITQIGPSQLQVSNNLTGTIAIGDKIVISGRDVIMSVLPGYVANGTPGFAFGDAQFGNVYSLFRNGATDSWDIGSSGGSLMRFAPGDYLGYAFGGGNDVVFPSGIEIGNYQEPIGAERNLDSGPASPATETIHLQGNVRLNSTPVPAVNLAWVDTEIFTTTLSGAVTAGTTTSVAVAGCPPTTVPAGAVIIDKTGKTGVVNGINLQQPISNYASCTGGALTLTGAALNSVPSGHTIQFLGWRPAGQIALDAAGTHYPVAILTTVANLAPCIDYLHIGLSVVNDGQTAAAAGYNAAVGSTTGGTKRLVFCDGTSWTYH